MQKEKIYANEISFHPRARQKFCQSCRKDVRLPVQLQRAMAAEVRERIDFLLTQTSNSLIISPKTCLG
jgi:hypothetical protein